MKIFFGEFHRLAIRFLIFLVSALMSSPLWAVDCAPNDISLSTQAEVDAFPAGCDTVVGNLDIESTDINNLDALSGLTSIGGDLVILGKSTLTNLDGLSGLTSVNGFLAIFANTVLTNLDGLSALTSVGNFVQISRNDALTNLDGLSALTSVGDAVMIERNPALDNLDGLSALTSVGGFVQISRNDALTNLDGLSGLTSIAGLLYLVQNPALTNLGGLSALTSIADYLYISNNDALANLDGLSALTSVGGFVQISGNATLTNLDGLSALTSVGADLSIVNNPQLSNCYALKPLLNDVDNPPAGPGVPPIPDVGDVVILGGNLPGCNTIGQILAIQPADGTAVLAIDKRFIDGNNETPVTLRMQCDGGSYTPEVVVVNPDEEGGDYEQAFVIFNMPPDGVPECTVTEDPVPGYHTISICAPDSMSDSGELCLDPGEVPEGASVYQLDGSACQWTDIQVGDSNRCQILNIPEPVAVEITKVWDVVNMGGKNFSKGVDIDLNCINDRGILGPDYWSLGNNDYEYLDDHTAIATVTTQVVPQWFPLASDQVTECWAGESGVASGVETQSDCGDAENPGMALTVGGGNAGCTITNTMFFEGIPTLNQYGMAILALLILGMGLVGFRRFV